MRLLRPLLSTAILGLCALLPSAAAAWSTIAIPTVDSFVDPCGTLGYLPCISGSGAAGIEWYIQKYIITGGRVIFLALAIVMFMYYAVRLISESENESVIGDTKNAYGSAIAGAALVSFASFFADAFTGTGTNEDIIVPGPAVDALATITIFLRLVVSVAASALIAFEGVRLIILQGQESEIEKQKKRFFHGLLGVAIVLLASVAVDIFIPDNGAAEDAIRAVTQLAGIANFLLTILGALAVLAFIVAGFLLVLSTDESLKDRAKKTMFTTVITLIVVLSSLIIVRFVMVL